MNATRAATTEEILKCAKGLKDVQVESVAMESTGVYWIPVMEIVENQGLEVLLIDTRPLSRVPGRKSDVSDCEWTQKLPSFGLLHRLFPASGTNRGDPDAGPSKGGAGSRAIGLGTPPAEVPGSDECAGASGGLRFSGHDRNGDYSRDRGR